MGNSEIKKNTEQLQKQKWKNDFYEVLASLIDLDDQILALIFEILKKEKIEDSLEFLQEQANERRIEKQISQIENNLLMKETKKGYENNNIKQIINFLKKIKDHEFNKENYSLEDYEEFKQDLIKKISLDKRITELLIFLVCLTAIDEKYIQSGSNSLHLLVEMKVDLKTQSLENIKIKNTSLKGANFDRCDLSGSEFDNVIISGMNLNGAKLFNCKWKNLRINELQQLCCNCRVNSVCFSPDGKSLAFCCADNFIRFLETRNGKIKSVIQGKSEVNSVCFSPNFSTLASCSGNFVCLWNFKTGKQMSKLIGHTDKIKKVCFSPDSTTLASGSWDNSIRLWDIKTGQQKAQLDGHAHYVNTVCFSPDGATLASGSVDNSVRLWDIKTRQQKAQLDGHSDWVNSVCFSPDGIALASGSDDKSIRLWDVKSGMQTAQLDGHTGEILSVCFSPDGTTLASGSSDNSIRLWIAKAGQQKAILGGHTNFIQSVCFSPAGTTLVSGSNDSFIRLWDLEIGQQILLQDNHYKESAVQFQTPSLKNYTPPESDSSHIKILRISQNHNLEAKGALILKGEFVNYQGVDLKQLFRSKGSCILESQIGL
ncbi:unnamed protein product [Paramecium octaurelia]|uniref:Anaphase-promoting complex subunit 4-like WD40 domain-containing protein n=1 Tax=Paramecium octaurelia TaxID=43137 RepID=A0A8S1TIW9_PAROT|nr:unnamed protein product [Paramecium octaurelia]